MAAEPLVVIVGPTASGKTSLAIRMARKYGGEIICADSRTVYKEMDIGTAKPTTAEQRLVPHWGLNLAEPGEMFTAADFKRYADAKIADIRNRGKVPFLVGGTGLYVDAVVFDYQFGSKSDTAKRRELENLTLDELYKYCEKNVIKLPENSKNKRYVVRAIEQSGINNSSRSVPIDNTIIVGIATDRDVLRTRISLRTEQLFADGVVDEAKMLGKKYGWDSEAMTGNVYRLIREYLSGNVSNRELHDRAAISDWRLAKRQMTWFRRNKYIEWLSLGDAEVFISGWLESKR
jgi:tRNA dimethylallyltransferase